MTKSLKIIDVGPATPQDLAWEDAAEKANLEALPRLRGTAEKWAGSISALLGLFGVAAVVSGPDQFSDLKEPYATEVAVGILIAAALAVTATVLALLAAQGSPTTLKLLTGERFRRWSESEFNVGRRRLAVSRWLTLTALAVLAVSIALAWFGPMKETASSPNVLVISPQGAACGRVDISKPETLTITGSRGSAVIPIRGIRHVVPVANCP